MIPLSDPGCERTLIGACILDPLAVAQMEPLDPSALSVPAHAAIWGGILALAGREWTVASLRASLGAACTPEVRAALSPDLQRPRRRVKELEAAPLCRRACVLRPRAGERGRAARAGRARAAARAARRDATLRSCTLAPSTKPDTRKKSPRHSRRATSCCSSLSFELAL